MIYIVLFFLSWVWVSYKRGDRVRTTQTCYLAALFLLLPFLIRLLFLIIYPQIFAALSFSSLLQGFGLGLRFDISMMCLLGGVFFILLNFPVQSGISRRIVGVLAVLVWGVYGLLLTGDLIYFGQVYKHTGNAIFDFFLSVPFIVHIAFYSYAWVCIAIGIAVGLCLYGVWRYMARQPAVRRGKLVYEVLFFILLIAFLVFGERGWFFNFFQVAPHQAYTRSTEQGHLALNGVFSMAYNLMPVHYVSSAKIHRKHTSFGEIDDAQSIRQAQRLLLAKEEIVPDSSYPLQRVRTKFAYNAQGKNLIILAIESFDYPSVDELTGGHLGATPNIDALMRQGVIWDKFYACKTSSLLGIGSIMSGICQVAGFPYFSRGLEQIRQQGIGTLLKSANYKTVFVQACRDKAMYIGPVSRLMGFESFGTQRIEKEYGYKQIHDEEALKVLADQFIKSKQPFFGFFFSTATHGPSDSELPKQLDASLVQKFSHDKYLLALSYTDRAIGQFVQTLKDHGLYENTVFILVGDHVLRSKAHTVSSGYHVPFAIVAPGILKPGRTDAIAGQTDILPTVVDLFHLQTPYAAMGRSLLDGTKKGWTFVSDKDGTDFAFLTAQGFIPANQPSSVHRDMIALNKAAYLMFQNNTWVK